MEYISIKLKKTYLNLINDLRINPEIPFIFSDSKKELMEELIEDIRRKISIFNYSHISNNFTINKIKFEKVMNRYEITFCFINGLNFGWGYGNNLNGWNLTLSFDENYNLIYYFCFEAAYGKNDIQKLLRIIESFFRREILPIMYKLYE